MAVKRRNRRQSFRFSAVRSPHFRHVLLARFGVFSMHWSHHSDPSTPQWTQATGTKKSTTALIAFDAVSIEGVGIL